MDTGLLTKGAVIARQQAVIDVERRIETEGEAKPGGPKGMPGMTQSGRQQTPREFFGRRYA